MLFERHVISLSSLVEADKSGLRAIVRVCENLIEGKPLTVDELWPGDTPELSGLLSDKGTFKDAYTSLRILKQTSQALAQLQLSLDTKLRVVQPPITKAAHHYGIRDLPDDLLVAILTVLVEADSEGPEREVTVTARYCRLISLALVDRRFHGIMNRTARCWSTVNLTPYFANDSNKRERRIIDISIEKSCNALLKLIWHCHEDCERDSFESLRLLRVRCESLDFGDGFFHSDSLMSLREPVVFPNLVTLKLWSKHYRPFDDGQSIHELLSHWCFPNLRHLSTYGCVTIPTTKLSQLTSLELQGGTQDIRDIRRSIQEATTLLRLKLNVYLTGEMAGKSTQDHIPTINLANLRTFEITISFDANLPSYTLLELFAEDAKSVTMGLQMPKVESMTFCVKDLLDYEEGRNPDWMLQFLSFHELFPVDESEHPKMAPVEMFLSLRYFDAPTPSYIQSKLVSDCLSRFPSVQSFTFSTDPFRDDALQYCISNLAKLRHLCIDIDWAFLGSLNVAALQKLFASILKQPVVTLETIALPQVDKESWKGLDGLTFTSTKDNMHTMYRTQPWGWEGDVDAAVSDDDSESESEDD